MFAGIAIANKFQGFSSNCGFLSKLTSSQVLVLVENSHQDNYLGIIAHIFVCVTTIHALCIGFHLLYENCNDNNCIDTYMYHDSLFVLIIAQSSLWVLRVAVLMRFHVLYTMNSNHQEPCLVTSEIPCCL